jgi:hypothetical protein
MILLWACVVWVFTSAAYALPISSRGHLFDRGTHSYPADWHLSERVDRNCSNCCVHFNVSQSIAIPLGKDTRPKPVANTGVF